MTPGDRPQTPPAAPSGTITEGRLGMVMGGVSLVVATLSLVVSFQQGQVSKEANDRAAGRIVPRFEIVKLVPHPDKLRPLFQPVHPADGTSLAHFRHVDDLLSFDPSLVVRNTGDEQIDSIRVETQELRVTLIEAGVPAERVPTFRPLLSPVHREDYTLSERFKPGQTATVPVSRPLLRALLQAQVQPDSDVKHAGLFEIRCFARCVGGTVYERADRNEGNHVDFCWYPKGFKEDGCKRYLDLTPTVKVGPLIESIGVR